MDNNRITNFLGEEDQTYPLVCRLVGENLHKLEITVTRHGSFLPYDFSLEETLDPTFDEKDSKTFSEIFDYAGFTPEGDQEPFGL